MHWEKGIVMKKPFVNRRWAAFWAAGLMVLSLASCAEKAN